MKKKCLCKGSDKLIVAASLTLKHVNYCNPSAWDLRGDNSATHLFSGLKCHGHIMPLFKSKSCINVAITANLLCCVSVPWELPELGIQTRIVGLWLCCCKTWRSKATDPVFTSC